MKNIREVIELCLEEESDDEISDIATYQTIKKNMYRIGIYRDPISQKGFL